VLRGSEVKSLRRGLVSLDEAFAHLRAGEVWLVQCEIQEYTEANRFNHDPRRPRKLLMHRREIHKFALKGEATGHTLVPLKLYFKEGRAKVLLGVCKGRKTHDKREVLKKRSDERDIQRAMKSRR
jgi:SsrA-binding protein